MLAAVLMLCLVAVPVFADGSSSTGTEKWNIMLVVDGSASLFSGQTTDPDGLRFEAIGSFLATLDADKTNVGAIIFTANDTYDPSDEAMRSGIKLNTGILPLTDSSAERYLLDSMQGVPQNLKSCGQTDIGTALLCAQETISALDNGNRSAIFLFTDGLTEVDGTAAYNKSMENMETAINNIRNENIMLCGVYLNKDGKQTSNEVRNIVMNANNITDNSLSLGDLYVEITDAKSCMDSTDRFLRALGYSIRDKKDEMYFLYDVDKTIRIPGVGVEEANIRLCTSDGQPLPQGFDVSITQPDGTVISGAAASAICSTGKSYRVYKIINPMCGTWNIHVEIPEGNKVTIKYNPIFSVNVGAVMNTAPAASELHANMDVEVTGQMTQAGQILTSREAYQEYSCSLHLTSVYTGETLDYEIAQDGNGSFTRMISLDRYGTYDAVLEFSCDEISVCSLPTSWVLENHAPTISSMPKENVPYGLFQKQVKELDLSAYASDLEDGQNISYVLSGGTCDSSGVSLSGDKLALRGEVCGSGTVIVDVIDSQGAVSQLKITVTVKNMTLTMILILVGVLLVLAIAALLMIRRINGMVPSGYCTLDFQITDENNRTVSASLKPNAPGTGLVGRKTTLFDILNAELGHAAIPEINPKDLEAVRSYMQSAAARELRDVAVKCVKGRVDKGNFNGKKVSVVQLAVHWDGQTNILYGNAITIRAGSAIFDFGYYDYDDNDYDDYDDYDNYNDY